MVEMTKSIQTLGDSVFKLAKARAPVKKCAGLRVMDEPGI